MGPPGRVGSLVGKHGFDVLWVEEPDDVDTWKNWIQLHFITSTNWIIIVVSTQSGAKDQFYSCVYYVNLNLNCEDQWVSKNEQKNCRRSG